MKGDKGFKIVTVPYADDENAHVGLTPDYVDAKKLKKFDTNYQYIKNGLFFRFFSAFFLWIAIVILGVLCRILYGLRVKGRENYRSVKGGNVICCSHNLALDCAIVPAVIARPRLIRVLTAPMAFAIPAVRHFVRLARAVPVPAGLHAVGEMQKQVVGALSAGESVLIFPESSNWEYYCKLRPFKKGAFSMAAKAGVPIVPITLTYRAPNLFYRMFGRKKPLITAVIGTAIPSLGKTADELKDETFSVMNADFNSALM